VTATVRRGAITTVIGPNGAARQALRISGYGLVLEQGQTRIEDTAAKILAGPRIAQLFLGGGLVQPEQVA
jgi:branched-chain amino acid transport system ATP-binding protein